MEMRMLKHLSLLNSCNTTKMSSNNNSFITPPEFGPNSKFSFPSIVPLANFNISNLNNLNNDASNDNPCIPSNNNSATNQNNFNLNNSNNGDLASVDSSDTYASCQTHPFLSQGDLTADDIDDNNLCNLDLIDTNNLYINPMDKGSSNSGANTFMRGNSLYSGGMSILDSSLTAGGSKVKKSASGDTALRSLGASPISDSCGGNERGSRVSLNETPVPKHRKTRFQQQQPQTNVNLNKPKARFEGGKESQESLDGTKKNRRASFMPTKSIATATKLINQHLFGIQTMGMKGKLLHAIIFFS
jgi:hypothetical protein